MACDHGMMLMSDHDDAYVDAMLMVNMQANTRRVTVPVSFDRVRQLDASRRGDPSRLSQPYLGHRQRVFEAGLDLRPLAGDP